VTVLSNGGLIRNLMETLMTRHRGKFVSYLRVSTARQGESGLGLAAQRAAVEAFLNGGKWELVEQFVEVESGKDDRNRPALQKALEACKVYGATLVIAKLDRLSRDAHFLTGLHKAGVKFIAADMPEANEMVVTIMAAVAQTERRMISERTKAALAAAKARGVKLGGPSGLPPPATAATRQKGADATAARAQDFAQRLRPILAQLHELSANAAAAELERRGIATSRGGKWSATAVIALRKRLEAVS
jgi:DNA invertase Pin-like site-specific DNA recombinase